jgi:hypothetical protein
MSVAPSVLVERDGSRVWRPERPMRTDKLGNVARGPVTKTLGVRQKPPIGTIQPHATRTRIDAAFQPQCLAIGGRIPCASSRSRDLSEDQARLAHKHGSIAVRARGLARGNIGQDPAQRGWRMQDEITVAIYGPVDYTHLMSMEAFGPPNLWHQSVSQSH